MPASNARRPLVLLPDLLFRDGGFVRGLAVEVDRGTGRITRVAPAAELTAGVRDVERLPARALMPGLANAHSHAFQRAIRGRTQWRPAGGGRSDFWSWRQAMYAAAHALSPDDVAVIARFVFLEMLRAGFTSVGEFHYLRRDARGNAYANPNEMSQRVIAAADEVGIRITLLETCYATSAIGEPLLPEQRRFATRDLDHLLGDVEALRRSFERRPRVRVGLAAHSIRAVPLEWLPRLREAAGRMDVPLHMHVAEQTAEVEACVEAHGRRPVELLDEQGLLDGRFVAVHATHLNDDEVAMLGRAGATVCACVATERDLGDGFLRGRDLLEAGARLAIGSDSHTIVDPFEEMRLIEYHERLQRRARNVIGAEAGGRVESAPPLLRAGMSGGAQALGVDAGRMEAGSLADLVALDLTHPSLAGWEADTLAATLVFSAPTAVVSDVWVGGVRRVADSRHALDGVSVITFRETVRRLFG